MRIVRGIDGAAPVPPEEPIAAAQEAGSMACIVPIDQPLPHPAPIPIEQHVAQVQAEINQLRLEVNTLRRRDETLKFYMHRLDEELRLAARLQQDFLPKTLPQVGTVRFHTLFRPAGYVSGDLYDVMRLDEHHVGFYLADAVGHGMPAALLTMFLKNALVTKQITSDGYRLVPPSQSMAKLNDALVDQNLSQATFATALYGSIDTHTLRMTFSRGGHPGPILLTSSGTLQPLEAEGSLLGIFPQETFSETTVQLQRGDRVFLFTDGIEVVFTDDQTMDTQRWRDELFARRHLTTEQLLADFAEHVDRESGSLTPKDDLTMIVMEIL
jgi:serine phosphatase RsbU (regulator of sigma subunit)